MGRWVSSPKKERLLLLEVLWGQDVAIGVQWRCPCFTPQLELLHLFEFLHCPENHLFLPVLIQEDRSAADESQKAVSTHPGGRWDTGLCWGAAVGPGVRQPAPDIAVIGSVRPAGKGGRQASHVKPCVKAPGVLSFILPRVD